VLRDGRFGCLVPVGEVPALAVAIAAALKRGRPAVPIEAWSRFTQDFAVEGYVRILRGSDASN
jgi:hypothetical protein